MTRQQPTLGRLPFIGIIAALAGGTTPVLAGDAEIRREGARPMAAVVPSGATSALSFNGQIFHHPAAGRVSGERTLTFPGSPTVMIVWQEPGPGGPVSHYAISRFGDRIDQVATTDNLIGLRYARFDPLAEQPVVPAVLQAGRGNELFLVQFLGTPLEEMREQIRAMGGSIERFLTENTHIVRMPEEVRQAVAGLPYIRWVGPFHPAYRLDEEVRGRVLLGHAGDGDPGAVRYSIECMGRGLEHQQVLADFIKGIGGIVERTARDTFRMEATLNLEQLLAVIHRNDVAFIDPWGPPGTDMDIARQIGGAVPTLSTPGFTGQGVRGSAVDSEVSMNHPEWASRPPLIHGPVMAAGTHGSSIYGINFAMGVQPQATGMMPNHEQGVFGYYNYMQLTTTSRVTYNLEAVDPNGPYRVVFQTNSWGNPQVVVYNSWSVEMDDAIFQSGLLVTQSQSNTNNNNSRPEAWAKNVTAVGGIQHQNTLTRNDDARSGASRGPAPDGRVKPDLAHFYDSIYTTTSGTGYTSFGGTSGATPITSGHFGLLFQMWHEEVFDGFGGEPTVFLSRPHYALAKAIAFATAYRYQWVSPPNPSWSLIDRDVQGWGMIDVGKMYNLREKCFLVNGDEYVANAQTLSFPINVEPGQSELLISMVYNDPPGTASVNPQRVNNLDLKVTSPSSVVYWGNNGLRQGNWSVPGGSPNTVDTAENVFIQNPESGQWLVEVIGSQVVADTVPQEPGVQANFGLAVFGGTGGPPAALRLTFPGGMPYLVGPGQGHQVSINIIPGSQTILPGSPTVHVRPSGSASFVSMPLTHVSGDEYTATLPPFGCGDTPELYFSAQGHLGEEIRLPRNAPQNLFSTNIGTIITVPLMEQSFPMAWPTGWNANPGGLWHVNSGCLPPGGTPCASGPYAYYGRAATCNYNLPTGTHSGSLNAPTLDLPTVPPQGTVLLKVCYALETENLPNVDKAELFVNGQFKHRFLDSEWTEAQFDLTEFAGQSVNLSFRFNTVNQLNNQYRGWHIGTVRVEATQVGCEDSCYANCDGSTTTPILNVEDFSCFINRFAEAQALPHEQQLTHYANCDQSTTAPVLNVEDFSCFINKFAQGCP
jgi:serine protease AprX